MVSCRALEAFNHGPPTLIGILAGAGRRNLAAIVPPYNDPVDESGDYGVLWARPLTADLPQVGVEAMDAAVRGSQPDAHARA